MKKLTEEFLKTYTRLDCLLKKKFSSGRGGVLEYARLLRSFSKIPAAELILERLAVYSLALYHGAQNSANIPQNKALGAGASPLSKSDLLWLKSFTKKIDARRDPLSRYLSCR